jgi:MATE family multidrug resistance protein
MPPVLARFLTDGRALATLAVPLALTQLAQVALTTTDTVMMGLIGTEALAAGGLAMVIFNQLRTMGVGLVTAVGNQVAAADARAETEGAAAEAAHEEVRDLVRASLLLSTLAGLAGAVLMVLIGHAVVFLGQDPDVVDAAKPVLYAMAPGLVPCLWFQAIRQFTVGMRRPQALLRITIASIAVNAGLNWVFIHGTWGLPKLGLPGIGLATTSVYALSCLALYSSARRDPRLAAIAASGPLKIAACHRRAVKWLFHAAESPLDDANTEVVNMRTLTAELACARFDDAAIDASAP